MEYFPMSKSQKNVWQTKECTGRMIVQFSNDWQKNQNNNNYYHYY